MKIKIGISTCPNDTFAFHGLLTDKVDCGGFEFEFELLDIQELNDRLFVGDFDIAKASFHAAILLADQMLVMPSGSALGFGVGPLLLAAEQNAAADSVESFQQRYGRQPIVLCPGQHTTATLLFQLFYPLDVQLRQVVFSEIMPMLSRGEADFGVCIHEGRFTWRESNLGCVADLGTRWESETKCALPLGGLLGKKQLGTDVLQKINAVIRSSIEYGNEHRPETLLSMRRYAQEFSDQVLMSHVDLYVNDWTIDLGETGRRALHELSTQANSIGIAAPENSELEIL